MYTLINVHIFTMLGLWNRSKVKGISGFPGGSVVKYPPANTGDTGSILGSERSHGEGHSNSFQYSCLENPMDRGAWWATDHEVPKSWTWLSYWAHRGNFEKWASLVIQMVKNPPAMWETWFRSLSWEDPLEEGMAVHSSILAWRIPMDRGGWWPTVHRVTKSWIWLINKEHQSI